MIPNEFFKNSTSEINSEILQIFNTSWQLSEVPKSWKQGVMVPIVKPGKAKEEITSYRPITLLPTLGKLMEKIVAFRLNFYMKTNNLYGSHQCGFRKTYSTNDIFLRLEKDIRQSIYNNKTMVVVYLDLKGAFDKVWHKGLLYKLSKLNIPYKLFKWIEDYLNERSFQVRINSEHSTIKEIGRGVPQGAILSPHLFNIMMADMPKENDIHIYNYADDITLSCIGEDTRMVKRKMQTYLNKLVTWLEGDGFTIETTKCKMQIYTKKKKVDDCLLKVKNFWLPKVKVKVLLGVTFDAPRLTFVDHIKELCLNIQKRLDIMKVMSSTVWGASQNILRQFYIAYIRSKIDYGSIIFCSAPDSALKKLDVLQNKALRMILGARNTSPLTSIEILANIEPLSIHRSYLKARNI